VTLDWGCDPDWINLPEPMLAEAVGDAAVVNDATLDVMLFALLAAST
jgi:hypothetical protein